MVRLSDILKKKLFGQNSPEAPSQKGPPKKTESQTPPLPSSLHLTKAMNSGKPSNDSAEQESQEMQIVRAMKEIKSDKEHCKNLYEAGIQFSQDILTGVQRANTIPLDLKQIKDWIAEIVDHLTMGDKELLGHFYEETSENYLYTHMVNVLLVSIELGLGLGYNKSRLNELGLAAFLCDVGMMSVMDIALKPHTLSREEYNRIKEHLVSTAKILSSIKDIPESVIIATKQHHERISGMGYPSGIKDGDISEYARIIALADVYEALTHNRPHRKRYPPHEAIKEILTKHGSLFDQAILRILINQVGVYPIGSWIELNTHEIGRVITTNDEFPLRPVIKLLFDSDRKRLEEPKVINLAKQPNLFIKGPLGDKDVGSLIRE